MDINLVKEQLGKLLVEKLEPVVEESDYNAEFPKAAYDAVADAGFGSIYLPEECGGGNSLDGLFAVMEEMSKFSPGFALSTMASFQLYGYNVARIGNSEQHERFLKPVVQDRKVGCWGLTEPDVGSDAVNIKTTAKKDGDHYILNGSKTFITNAPIADYFIIIANTGGEGFDAGSTFVLEKGMEGLSVSKPFRKHGHRCSPTGQVFMENVKVPAANRLGEEGQAFRDMKHSLDIERLMVGPMMIGTLETLIERCVKYAYSREQFGQPILFFQLIQEKIATMRMQLEVIRATTNQAREMMHRGEDIKNIATALKLYAGKAGVEAGLEAMQVHGGNGYMHEYRVEMFMRDAKLMEIGGGTSEIMKQILAKNTIKEIGRKFGVV